MGDRGWLCARMFLGENNSNLTPLNNELRRVLRFSIITVLDVWVTRNRNVSKRVQEKNFSSLGEELLALDPRDRHVVPQLMRLQACSEVALSKALRTCDGDLVLLALLHSFDDCYASERSRHFYEFLRDSDGSEIKGMLREQAGDTWHHFVISLVVPFPNIALVRSSIISSLTMQRCNAVLLP
jgi:hypothetical protein